MATGGSLHGWKFLPSLGDFVVDSMTGALEPELVEKWSWESKETAKHNAYGFMLPGAVREMRDVIGESEKPRVQEPLVSLD